MPPGDRPATDLAQPPREMIEAGKLKPVVDGVFPMADSAAAFRHLGDGPARGKAIVTI